MRVALISDIHANLVALRAVLDEIEQVGADRIVCLGDIADLGPLPCETVAAVRALGCSTIVGNHDVFDGSEVGPPEVMKYADWCQEQLSDDDLAWLRGLPATVEIDLGGGRRLLCVHGSPRSYDEGLVAGLTVAELDALLAGHEGVDVICGGHTHVQLFHRHGRTLVVNVGSVGSAFETVFNGSPPKLLPWAEYAIVEASADGISVDLRRVAFDVDEVVAQLRASSLPDAEEWAQQWERA